MNFYEKLPNELLIDFYNEINRTIENGTVTKTHYYELGLIISIMHRKGIRLQNSGETKTQVDKNGMETISA